MGSAYVPILLGLAAVVLLAAALAIGGWWLGMRPSPVAPELAAPVAEPSASMSREDGPSPMESRQATPSPEPTAFVEARAMMVQRDLRRRDITDPKVLDVMGRVPRHEFVPPAVLESAYADRPLPIGYGQTISQPYIVALMTQLVEPNAHGRALDVGTGSGYQAAVLAELYDEVYAIEIVEPLAEESAARLRRLGYDNVTVRAGDGYRGWPEKAPFDAIIVAAAPDHVPSALVEQLAPGGRLVIPVGRAFQQLLLIEKREDGTVDQRKVAAVAFVPMTGEAEQ